MCSLAVKVYLFATSIGFGCCVWCRKKYDVFADESVVSPSVLQPAKMLQWKISPSTVADIKTASNNLDR